MLIDQKGKDRPIFCQVNIMKSSYLYVLSNMMPCQLEIELKKWEQKAKHNPNNTENQDMISRIEGLIEEKRALIESKIHQM